MQEVNEVEVVYQGIGQLDECPGQPLLALHGFGPAFLFRLVRLKTEPPVNYLPGDIRQRNSLGEGAGTQRRERVFQA
jgi:hypothetical protein